MVKVVSTLLTGESMLEPYVSKGTCTVLRGERGRNTPDLPDEVPEEKVIEAARFIKACMEQRPFEAFDVPIVAETAVGRRFGEMKEMEVWL